jgi:hypothetical protein
VGNEATRGRGQVRGLGLDPINPIGLVGFVLSYLVGARSIHADVAVHGDEGLEIV